MEQIATRDAYGKALKKLAETRDDIVVLDADLSKSTKTAEFKKIRPEHFINVGIAEQNLMGIAAGIATTGKIPFASTFAMFATGRAFEAFLSCFCRIKKSGIAKNGSKSNLVAASGKSGRCEYSGDG